MERFGSARDYFESVRDAAIELDRTGRTLERMRASMGPKSQRYDRPGGRGGTCDPTRRADDIVDYEAIVRGRVESDGELIADAGRVLYGEDGRAGVALGMGPAYADAVYRRACDALTWDGVARALFVSRGKARQLYDAAIDYVDAAGLDGAAAGVGI